jgi:osmotically-inducible protein OsmY
MNLPFSTHRTVRSARTLIIGTALIASALLSGCASDSPEARSRSAGNYIDDRVITHKVLSSIEDAHPTLADSHIDIDTFNGAVLLVGQIPSAELRDLAARTAANVPNVRRVYNETTIGPDIGFAAHASDALLTSKVKSQLWAQESIKDSKMVVLTEAGVVYLMGIVSQEQSDLAAKVAQNIDGVQKVVRLFEIIGQQGNN